MFPKCSATGMTIPPASVACHHVLLKLVPFLKQSFAPGTLGLCRRDLIRWVHLPWGLLCVHHSAKENIILSPEWPFPNSTITRILILLYFCFRLILSDRLMPINGIIIVIAIIRMRIQICLFSFTSQDLFSASLYAVTMDNLISSVLTAVNFVQYVRQFASYL